MPLRKPLIVSLDLEMNQPSGSIIQIGAIIGNLETGEVIDRLDIKVALPAGEVLAPAIAELTGITEAELTGAAPLAQAFQMLQQWLAPYAEHRLLNPLTWGGGDTETLRQALGADKERWPFGRRWIDAKTLYVSWRLSRGEEIQGGLARAMTKLGLAFDGRKHQAPDDAHNTFRIYRALLDKFSSNL